MIISIDFDGTIVKHMYPKIGDPLPHAFETLRALKKNGHVLILSTCREDVGYNINKRYLHDAVEFCKENGVEFDGINETPIEHDFREDWPQRRKIYANVYIDDTNFGGFPGWKVVASAFGIQLEENNGK